MSELMAFKQPEILEWIELVRSRWNDSRNTASWCADAGLSPGRYYRREKIVIRFLLEQFDAPRYQANAMGTTFVDITPPFDEASNELPSTDDVVSSPTTIPAKTYDPLIVQHGRTTFHIPIELPPDHLSKILQEVVRSC